MSVSLPRLFEEIADRLQSTPQADLIGPFSAFVALVAAGVSPEKAAAQAGLRVLTARTIPHPPTLEEVAAEGRA